MRSFGPVFLVALAACHGVGSGDTGTDIATDAVADTDIAADTDVVADTDIAADTDVSPDTDTDPVIDTALPPETGAPAETAVTSDTNDTAIDSGLVPETGGDTTTRWDTGHPGCIDRDHDGVCKREDNCDDRPNPGQEDICNVWFVDAAATGAGTGKSWADAFTTVQAAVDASDWWGQYSVWVAAGTYKAAAPGDDLVRTHPEANLKFYGGFAGTEMTLAARAGLFDETVLDGDTLGDDPASRSDNAGHLFWINDRTTAVIDGFNLRSAEQAANFGGAGIFAGEDVHLTVRNSTFHDLHGVDGGAGINLRGSADSLVEDCTFHDVHTDASGAAIDAGLNGTLTMRNVTISDASEGWDGYGEAIDISRGTVTIDNLSVLGTDHAQPAIRLESGALALRNSAFWGNDSAVGDANNLATVTNVCAPQDLSSYDASNVRLDRSTAALGAPFVRRGHRLDLAHADAGQAFTSACVNAGNDAAADLAVPDWASQTTRTDEVADAAPVDAGAHYSPDTDVPADTGISSDTDTGVATDTHDSAVDTGLVPETGGDTAAILDTGSVCVDQDHDGICRWDDNCDDRPNPGQEDICHVWFVDDSATGAGTGKNWADAFTTVQEAVAALGFGETIWVATGTYRPTAPGRDLLHLRPSLDLRLYGGFAGDEMTLAARAGRFNDTVLTGDVRGDDPASLSDNAGHLVFVEQGSTVVVDGFTLTGAHQTTGFGGAGVFVTEGSTVTVRNSRFHDLTGVYAGTGVNLRGAAGALVEDCVFYDVHSDEAGAAISATVDGALTVRNVTIADAVAGMGGYGEAIDIQRGAVTIDNISVLGTDPAQPAIRLQSGSLALRNSAFWGNEVSVAAPLALAKVTNVCAPQDLSSYSESNVFLDDTTPALGDPFVHHGDRLDLAQVGSGQSTTSACVDAGDDSAADLAVPDWASRSTRTDDVADATPVDAGAHYRPDDHLCLGDVSTGDADHDGICVSEDNCDDRPNPGQEDICHVWFVDDSATGAGTGRSWADAFTTVQAAAAMAGWGEAIWVATGTYRPAAPGNDFLVVSDRRNLQLYGGFAADERTLAARAGRFDETVLTGDALGDDPASLSDNSRHLVVVDQPSTIVVDGFTLTAAHETTGFGGAGIYVNEDSNMTVRNSIFHGLTGVHAGTGVNLRGSAEVVIEDCVFYDVQTDEAGAAISAAVNGALTIRNVTIADASEGWDGYGEAIDISRGAVTIDSVSVLGTDPAQAAIRFESGSLTLRNSAFWGNDVALADPSTLATATNVCAPQDLSSYASANVTLDQSTAALGDPFVRYGYRLDLAHADAGQALTSACVDAGSDSAAVPGWTSRSTRTDDGLDATPVDAGAHYRADTSVCLGNDAAGDANGDHVCDDVGP